VSIGGHNLLEPASLGLPIIVGPYIFTIKEMSERFLEAKALSIVPDSQALEVLVEKFIHAPELAKAQGLAAKQVAEQNRGALKRLVDIIEGHIKKRIHTA
jgi:3-deoxy-D-manno-octulosonic-acid transferase